MRFVVFACIAFLLSFTAKADGTAGAQRLSYAVICDDPQLAEKINGGVRSRLERVKKEIVDRFPTGKLFLYVQRDVSDRKNPKGVSVAIAHVSNVQPAAFALTFIEKKAPLPDQLAAMLREEGFLKHLSVAHMDEPSDEEIGILLDSVVKTFLSKY